MSRMSDIVEGTMKDMECISSTLIKEAQDDITESLPGRQESL